MYLYEAKLTHSTLFMGRELELISLVKVIKICFNNLILLIRVKKK